MNSRITELDQLVSRRREQMKKLIELGDQLAERVPDYEDGCNDEVVARWTKATEEILRELNGVPSKKGPE